MGLGTSAAYPAAMTMIRARAGEAGVEVPSRELGRLAITSQVSAAVGPALGGLLVGFTGWRSIFLVNVPVALTGIVLAALWLPADRPERRDRRGALDMVGVGLFATGLTVLLFFLMRLRAHPPYVLLGAAIAIFALLVAWELRRDEPFIDVRMLAANRPLTVTYARYALTWLLIYSVMYGLSQWLEEGRGLSPGVTAMVTLPMPIVGTIAATVASRRPRVRGPMVIGTVAMVAGTLVFTVLDGSTPLAALVAMTALLGLPQGLGPVSNQVALYRQAPADRTGSAAGLLRTSQYVGAVLQSSLIGAVYGARADDHGLHRLAPPLIAFGVVLLAITLADRSLRSPRRDRHGPEG
jgi:MFS family permease